MPVQMLTYRSMLYRCPAVFDSLPPVPIAYVAIPRLLLVSFAALKFHPALYQILTYSCSAASGTPPAVSSGSAEPNHSRSHAAVTPSVRHQTYHFQHADLPVIFDTLIPELIAFAAKVTVHLPCP